MTKRRDFIKFLGASSSIALVRTARGEDDPGSISRPNVLFVLADQWRGSALEFGPANDNSYAGPGKQLLKTPRLKAFGDEGVRLDRCYATKPVCTPNRSAIITGKYPHETGMFDNSLMLPPDIPCMPDVFKDAGYRTYYVGKWHMDGTGKGTSGTPAAGFVPNNWRRRGLDRFDGMNRGHSYFANSFMLDDDGTAMAVPAANPTGTLDEQLANFEPHRQADLVIDYLDDHSLNHADDPFFIWLNFGPPHDPFTPPAPFDTYDGNQLTPRPNNDNSSNMTALSNYYGLCEALDHEFGRILDKITALGLEGDTIVVFTSDHGEMMGSHGLVRKGYSEDESWRVPFLARWSGETSAGIAADTPFSGVDIMPTLLSLCGLEIPDSVTGADKSAVLRGQPIAETPVFGENEGGSTVSNWRGLVKRTGGATYKHVLSYDPTTGAPLNELFNLDADPFELTNLYDDPAHAAVQDELVADLSAWRASSGDTYWPTVETPRASTRYADEEPTPETIESRMVKKPDGKHYMQVKSISRVYFTLEESTDMSEGSWQDVGTAKHGNGNWLNFEIPEPPIFGIPRMFYRVRAEGATVNPGEKTDFVEGGDVAGASTADWSNGPPTAANTGTIGLDITGGTMGGDLVDADITQLAGTIVISSGLASNRSFRGSTHYTLVGGVFRRTTSHVLRLGNNSAASDVVFHVVGGLLDLSSSAGSTGVVFMGTDSVLRVSGGTVDVSGSQIQLHTTSSHTDTAFLEFEEGGTGTVTCAKLTFQPGKLGYVNVESDTSGALTVTDEITNDGTLLTGTRAQQFEALWTAGRLRFNDDNLGNFADIFEVVSDTLRLKV